MAKEPNYSIQPPAGANAPKTPQNDMYKAWNFTNKKLPELCRTIEEKYYKVHPFAKHTTDEPIGVRPEDFDVSYSKAANAIRIVSQKHDICVTCRYNVWDKQRNEFVDLAYFRLLSEQRQMGDGYLFTKGVYNGNYGVGFDTNDDYSERLKKGEISGNQDVIAGGLCETLITFHHDPNSGIGIVKEYQDVELTPEQILVNAITGEGKSNREEYIEAANALLQDLGIPADIDDK
jgi:hypothetical protein